MKAGSKPFLVLSCTLTVFLVEISAVASEFIHGMGKMTELGP